MSGSLIEVIDHLDEVDDSDHFPPLCIFAEGGPDAAPGARALVCPGDKVGSFACPQDTTLTYVVEVELAKGCVQGLSEGRGTLPTPHDKFAAVIRYARNDA